MSIDYLQGTGMSALIQAATSGGGAITSIDILQWSGPGHDDGAGDIRWPITIGENEFLICIAHWQPITPGGGASFWLSDDGYATGSHQAQPASFIFDGSRITSVEYLIYDDTPGSPVGLTPGAQTLYWDGVAITSEFTGYVLHVSLGSVSFVLDLDA